ncbi:hypothetical protein BT69DRAFT_1280629 [Atractiella rhizophila]|nr:hypothetical protein BT69DRAFT_1280629 [Atractiella rhizophila]
MCCNHPKFWEVEAEEGLQLDDYQPHQLMVKMSVLSDKVMCFVRRLFFFSLRKEPRFG